MIKILKLSDVCTDIIDCPHESPVWLTEGYARVIRNFNLIDGQISDVEPYYVDENTYNKRTRRAIPEPGDIIFSREAPIGNCAIVPEGFKCCLGQRLVLLKVDHSKVSSNYLLTVLMSNYVKYQIEQVSKRGSIVSNFNIGDLSNLKIPVLTNQSDIAQFANDISSKITNNRCINNKLESLAKTIYDYWFLQFEFPNEEGKPYKSSGGKMVWNNELKREIPEGWEVRPILDFCSWEGTSQPPKSTFAHEPKDGYIRFIQNRDYEDDMSHPTYIPLKENTPVCDERDILIDKYGDAGRVRFGLNGAYNVALSMIVVKNKDFREYIRSFFESESTYNYLHNSSMASTRASLNENNVSYLYLPVPPKSIIDKYTKIANLRIETALKTRKENKELASLRDFLLPMLMNGQITFKDN